MNTHEIVAILERIKDFYVNDGHFIAKNEAEKEIEALKHAIKAVELQVRYAEALTVAYSLLSRHYQSGYLLEIERLLDEVVISKMETVRYVELYDELIEALELTNKMMCGLDTQNTYVDVFNYNKELLKKAKENAHD